jgi:uncharacterized protein
MSIPSDLTRTSIRDLNDAEFDELDELLAQTPEPLQALDPVMLDGYLCGVLVQPRLMPREEWLPPVFDYEGGQLPDDVDAAWLERVTALITRRHAALGRTLAENGWFDPLVLDAEAQDAEGEPPTPEQAAEEAAVLAGMNPLSRSLMPWVAGFQHATLCFPELADLPDAGVMNALARLFRHLPAETDEERELLATMDKEFPLKDIDDAVEDMVAAVAEISDLTRVQRYKVEAVKRDAPKVGRNDPCPCGSGRKFKVCHGAN